MSNDNPLVEYARRAARSAGIDENIFLRQIGAESNWDPAAESGAGAIGIAQIVPRWHPDVDPRDPYASLDYAAKLMASHLQNYNGDYSIALAAYNAGPGAVQQYGGVPPFEETKNYVAKILGSGSGIGGGGGGRFMSTSGRGGGYVPQFSLPNIPPWATGSTRNNSIDPGTSGSSGPVGDRWWDDPSFRDGRSGGAGGERFPIHTVDLGTKVIVYFDDGTSQYIDKNRFASEQNPEDARQFDITTQFNQAVQNWKAATDARDFEAAEKWRTIASDLEQKRFGQQQYTDEANISLRQNQMAMEYLRQLQSLKGPQDWVSYWNASRGQTNALGGESVPYDEALPPWLRPRALPGQPSQPGAISSIVDPPPPAVGPVGGGVVGGGAPSSGGGGASAPAWMYDPAIAGMRDQNNPTNTQGATPQVIAQNTPTDPQSEFMRNHRANQFNRTIDTSVAWAPGGNVVAGPGGIPIYLGR